MKLQSLPELLAPAGDTERLQAAVEYGADAVYLGAENFGMRTAAATFDPTSLENACNYAHGRGVKVYLTCNTVPRNEDLEKLDVFLKTAQKCGVDALIVTDIGVMMRALELVPDIDIHISTQAGITNYAAAKQFKALGAKRIVTAREISLEEIAQIRQHCPDGPEIESFVHGAMCVSFSGRCLLSNYLTGRDSNRGDCAQPCRWKYTVTEETRPGEQFPVDEDESGTYIFNSRDMCMIEHIASLAYAGIDSFKIEGRAKSAYYTAVTVNAYRSALDAFKASGFDPDFKPEKWMVEELYKVSNREYCTGFYFSSPGKDAQIYYNGGYVRNWEIAAVAENCENGTLFATQRNRFFEGDELEVMAKGRRPFKITVRNLKNGEGENIDNAPHPMMALSFDCDEYIPKGAYLRRCREN